ncbi:Uncharacterized conserved protein YndB, AHSA1/START domain [Amycolatopsis arida]|uniref:Uncharacterized conserved protein YndB, AHSA1/START domain n=1 Tax=Amycolatopsis arida TaxID=587909 RepID=A0A1I5YLQ4_9PSEU|nr:SRPBCC domain-containing protein [Amycolatopsis arida]TDX90605.1 uncharacterized protein YndB with AHSA1/START domain [Amycolatopsis arida]SFQ45082.1 Uncharacterized conserved protein YndB, AHSA1/START domain [Amycolatopsis arida]
MDIDRIERDVLIAAPPERVWTKLVEFAWADTGGSRVGVEPRPGERFVAENPEHGKFPIVVERVERPRHLAYRWASAFAGQEPAAGNSTLVEFTLIEEAGGTRLAVVESGFAGLPAESRRGALDDNTRGWTEQLDALRQRVEAAAG